ncbi:MAG: hypothetical protein FJY76_02570 [Candidatus Aenigmarchaeota archaeon]|nr:hypothetical protein [Candidatus Aenigmarchaeota archaeon]
MLSVLGMRQMPLQPLLGSAGGAYVQFRVSVLELVPHNVSVHVLVCEPCGEHDDHTAQSHEGLQGAAPPPPPPPEEPPPLLVTVVVLFAVWFCWVALVPLLAGCVPEELDALA